MIKNAKVRLGLNPLRENVRVNLYSNALFCSKKCESESFRER
jgi:hypothetical protein